jgi:hypothetical protein
MALEVFRSPSRQIPGYSVELEHDRSHPDIFPYEEKNYNFLPSTKFKSLSQIKGNSVNDCYSF